MVLPSLSFPTAEPAQDRRHRLLRGTAAVPGAAAPARGQGRVPDLDAGRGGGGRLLPELPCPTRRERGRGCTCWPPATRPPGRSRPSCSTGPSLLDRVRLCDAPAGRSCSPSTSPPASRSLSERLGLPLYGPPASLAGLGSKTGSRRVARLARWRVLDGAEDLRSVEAVEAEARRLRRRGVPPVGAVVIKLNDGFSGQGNAVVESWFGLNGSLDSPVVFCAEEGDVAVVRGQDRRGRRGRGEPAGRPRHGLPERAAAHPARRDAAGPVHPQPGPGRPQPPGLFAAASRPTRPTAPRSRPRPSGWAESWPPVGSSATSGSTSSSPTAGAGVPVRDQPPRRRHHPPVRHGQAGHRRALRRRRRGPGRRRPGQGVPGHRQPQGGVAGRLPAPGGDRPGRPPRARLRPPPPHRHQPACWGRSASTARWA